MTEPNHSQKASAETIKYYSCILQVDLNKLNVIYRENYLEEGQKLSITETTIASELDLLLQQSGIRIFCILTQVSKISDHLTPHQQNSPLINHGTIFPSSNSKT